MKNNNNVTIQSLRKSGHLIRVVHLRAVAPDKKKLKELSQPRLQHILKGKFKEFENNSKIEVPLMVLPRGGKTVIEIDSNKKNHYEAEAKVSKLDAYNKKAGILKCLSKIVFQMRKNGEEI